MNDYTSMLGWRILVRITIWSKPIVEVFLGGRDGTGGHTRRDKSSFPCVQAQHPREKSSIHNNGCKWCKAWRADVRTWVWGHHYTTPNRRQSVYHRKKKREMSYNFSMQFHSTSASLSSLKTTLILPFSHTHNTKTAKHLPHMHTYRSLSEVVWCLRWQRSFGVSR